MRADLDAGAVRGLCGTAHHVRITRYLCGLGFTGWPLPLTCYRVTGSLGSLVPDAGSAGHWLRHHRGTGIRSSDYQQGDAFRIIYVHAAQRLAVSHVVHHHGGSGRHWSDLAHQGGARRVGRRGSIGASFTLLALVTGSLWGRPCGALTGPGIPGSHRNSSCCSYTLGLCPYDLLSRILGAETGLRRSWALSGD